MSMPTESNDEFYVAMQRERLYQLEKWGQNSHTVGEWILIAEQELRKARQNWVEHRGDEVALERLLTTATVIMACFEEHDIVDCHLYE